MIRILLLTAFVVALAPFADAASTAEHQARRPELFDPATGLRIARQRAPTPDDVPGASRVDVSTVQALIASGAILIDVGAAARSHFDAIDGTWLVNGEHQSLPGATWLPETGRGTLSSDMQRYLADNVARLTGGDRDLPLVVFCIADCWMSWNATRRLTAMGHTRVHWFAEGTDGWLDADLPLTPVAPVPVVVD